RLLQGDDFHVLPGEKSIRLTERGARRVIELTSGLTGLWIIRRAREDTIRQALSALHLFRRDVQYIVAGGTVASRYRNGIGDLELWLVDYPRDVSTSVEVGVGDLTVVVPDDARVQIDARVGIGTIDTLGSSVSGYRRTLTLDTKQGGRLIKLRLRVGAGSIDVHRASSEGFPFPVPVPTTTGAITAPFSPVVQQFNDGTVVYADGSIDFGDGRRIEADGTYQIPIVEQHADGSVQLDNGATIRADGTVVSPGGFVIQRGARPPSVSPVPTSAAVPATPQIPTSTTTSGVQP
ncbi:MAG: preprotein translocase subunit SecA, partial [Ilumatobacteraceae bacterium]